MSNSGRRKKWKDRCGSRQVEDAPSASRPQVSQRDALSGFSRAQVVIAPIKPGRGPLAWLS